MDTTEFLGYNTVNAQAKVLAIVVSGRTKDRIDEGNSAEVIFNQSPFYAESGGQISDSGYVNNEIFEAEILFDFKRLLDARSKRTEFRKRSVLNINSIAIATAQNTQAP